VAAVDVESPFLMQRMPSTCFSEAWIRLNLFGYAQYGTGLTLTASEQEAVKKLRN
jgi:hypothetical protein